MSLFLCLLLTLSPALADPTEDAPVEPIDAEVAEEAAETAAAEEAGAEGAAEEAPPEPEWSPKWPGEPEPGSKHYDLEELYAAKKYREGWKAAKARLEANPDDPDLYWILARFMYEVGELMDKNTDDKESHYEEMVRIAEEGLKRRPGDVHLTFAHGIGLGRLGTTRGVLASLWGASTVESEWLMVANSDFRYASIDGNELLPCDAQYALGIFYRLVPDSWIVKVLSGTRGSLDKSIAYHEKANACSPGRFHIAKELGVSRMCKGLGDKDDALVESGKASLRTVLKMNATTEKEKIDKRHAQMLIDNPSLACGYSRDGQQDLDESKLKQ